MRIYLAGKMRGVPHFNFPAFIEAAGQLREMGHEVFSPAERDIEAGFDWQSCPNGSDAETEINAFSLREALQADTEFITIGADAVVVLPGWEASAGAKAEVALALALELPVYEFYTIKLKTQMSGIERIHPTITATSNHLLPISPAPIPQFDSPYSDERKEARF